MSHSGETQDVERAFAAGAGPAGTAAPAVVDADERGATLSSGLRAPGSGPARCLDCEAPLTGPFCANCGQAAGEAELSLRKLLHELADDYLNFDSRFFRSVVPLLVRPGHLTREYLRGRRTRYIRPLRLYLVSSLIFFFIVSIGSGRVPVLPSATQAELQEMRTGMIEAAVEPHEDELTAATGRMSGEAGPEPGEAAAREAGTPEAPEATSPEPATGESALPGTARTPDETPESEGTGLGDALRRAFQGEAVTPAIETSSTVGRVAAPWLVARAQRIGELEQQTGWQGLGQIFKREMARQAPTMIFLLLPVFALLLKILYLGSGRSYLEHMIFGLHAHAFVYLLLLLLHVVGEFRVIDLALTALIVGYGLAMIVRVHRRSVVRLILLSLGLVFLAWRLEIGTILQLWIPVYLFLSMREVYGQSRITTAFKFFMLGSSYTVLLVFAVLLQLVIVLSTL